jgi:hypothetical protein
MSIWNGRISVAVSTVAMPTSRSSVDPSIVEGRRITASAANFVETVALRRRCERSNDETLRVPAASQSCSLRPYKIRSMMNLLGKVFSSYRVVLSPTTSDTFGWGEDRALDWILERVENALSSTLER